METYENYLDHVQNSATHKKRAKIQDGPFAEIDSIGEELNKKKKWINDWKAEPIVEFQVASMTGFSQLSQLMSQTELPSVSPRYTHSNLSKSKKRQTFKPPTPFKFKTQPSVQQQLAQPPSQNCQQNGQPETIQMLQNQSNVIKISSSSNVTSEQQHPQQQQSDPNPIAEDEKQLSAPLNELQKQSEQDKNSLVNVSQLPQSPSKVVSPSPVGMKSLITDLNYASKANKESLACAEPEFLTQKKQVQQNIANISRLDNDNQDEEGLFGEDRRMVTDENEEEEEHVEEGNKEMVMEQALIQGDNMVRKEETKEIMENYSHQSIKKMDSQQQAQEFGRAIVDQQKIKLTDSDIKLLQGGKVAECDKFNNYQNDNLINGEENQGEIMDEADEEADEDYCESDNKSEQQDYSQSSSDSQEDWEAQQMKKQIRDSMHKTHMHSVKMPLADQSQYKREQQQIIYASADEDQDGPGEEVAIINETNEQEEEENSAVSDGEDSEIEYEDESSCSFEEGMSLGNTIARVDRRMKGQQISAEKQQSSERRRLKRNSVFNQEAAASGDDAELGIDDIQQKIAMVEDSQSSEEENYYTPKQEKSPVNKVLNFYDDDEDNSQDLMLVKNDQKTFDELQIQNKKIDLDNKTFQNEMKSSPRLPGLDSNDKNNIFNTSTIDQLQRRSETDESKKSLFPIPSGPKPSPYNLQLQQEMQQTQQQELLQQLAQENQINDLQQEQYKDMEDQYKPLAHTFEQIVAEATPDKDDEIIVPQLTQQSQQRNNDKQSYHEPDFLEGQQTIEDGYDEEDIIDDKYPNIFTEEVGKSNKKIMDENNMITVDLSPCSQHENSSSILVRRCPSEIIEASFSVNNIRAGIHQGGLAGNLSSPSKRDIQSAEKSNSRSQLTSNDKYSAVDRKSSEKSSSLSSRQSEENHTSRFGDSPQVLLVDKRFDNSSNHSSSIPKFSSNQQHLQVHYNNQVAGDTNHQFDEGINNNNNNSFDYVSFGEADPQQQQPLSKTNHLYSVEHPEQRTNHNNSYETIGKNKRIQKSELISLLKERTSNATTLYIPDKRLKIYKKQSQVSNNQQQQQQEQYKEVINTEIKHQAGIQSPSTMLIIDRQKSKGSRQQSQTQQEEVLFASQAQLQSQPTFDVAEGEFSSSNNSQMILNTLPNQNGNGTGQFSSFKTSAQMHHSGQASQQNSSQPSQQLQQPRQVNTGTTTTVNIQQIVNVHCSSTSAATIRQQHHQQQQMANTNQQQEPNHHQMQQARFSQSQHSSSFYQMSSHTLGGTGGSDGNHLIQPSESVSSSRHKMQQYPPQQRYPSTNPVMMTAQQQQQQNQQQMLRQLSSSKYQTQNGSSSQQWATAATKGSTSTPNISKPVTPINNDNVAYRQQKKARIGRANLGGMRSMQSRYHLPKQSTAATSNMPRTTTSSSSRGTDHLQQNNLQKKRTFLKAFPGAVRHQQIDLDEATITRDAKKQKQHPQQHLGSGGSMQLQEWQQNISKLSTQKKLKLSEHQQQPHLEQATSINDKSLLDQNKGKIATSSNLLLQGIEGPSECLLFKGSSRK